MSQSGDETRSPSAASTTSSSRFSRGSGPSGLRNSVDMASPSHLQVQAGFAPFGRPERGGPKRAAASPGIESWLGTRGFYNSDVSLQSQRQFASGERHRSLHGTVPNN